MRGLTNSPRRWPSLIAGVALIICCFVQAAAQQGLTPPKADVKGTVGGSTFGDGEVPHGVFGGSVRFYLTRRLSVEPEFLYMYHSRNDKDFIFQPNLAFDITNPTGRVVPYVIGGAGVLHHRGRFVGTDLSTFPPRPFDVTVSSTTWTASAGAGVKIFVTDRVFIAPEARIGREPTLRGTFSVGYVFSGRR